MYFNEGKKRKTDTSKILWNHISLQRGQNDKEPLLELCMQTRQRLQFLLSIYDTFCLCSCHFDILWHFVAAPSYISHTVSQNCHPPRLFEASNPIGFCISITIKLGMWHGVKPFWDKSLHILWRNKGKIWFSWRRFKFKFSWKRFM